MVKLNKRQEAMLRVMFNKGKGLSAPHGFAEAAYWYATARALARRGFATVAGGICNITSEGADWVVDQDAAREAHEQFLEELHRDCQMLAEMNG